MRGPAAGNGYRRLSAAVFSLGTGGSFALWFKASVQPMGLKGAA
jgi:hypothetical protein